MRKIFSLIAAVLFAGSMFAADATMTKGTNGYDDFTVNSKPAIKVGTGSKGGDMTVTVGAGATSLTVYAAAWKGVNGLVLNITAPDGVTITPASITLTAEDAFTGSEKAFTVANESAYKFDFVISGAEAGATFTFATATQKRFLMWSATYETGEVAPVVEYYVVGSMNNWALDAAYKLAANPAVSGEFMKRFTFAANDELKVRKAIDGVLDAWYPEGMGNNWVINEAGEYDVYFRPEGNTEWANGYFFVAPYVVPQYEVAEAIAAGLTNGTEIKVRGIVSKIELKGKNFANYGSACIYVADATDAEGQFEFYNCLANGSVKFTVTDPAYDATSTAWAEFNEVATADGYAIHVGDTVIAQGKYKLYNTTYELDQNCYIVYAKAPGALYPTNIENAATEQKAVKFFENGQLLINKNGVIYNAQGAVVR